MAHDMEDSRRRALIGLLTDFGDLDTYVGVMKAIIAGIAPSAAVIDLGHRIRPGDIRQAAFQLWQVADKFPAGSVLVVVVDPGVGTARRAVACQWRQMVLVGPDNGVFTYLLAIESASAAVVLAEPRFHHTPVSATFHGRDIFAPVAAHLAGGTPLKELGPATDGLQQFELPLLERLGADGLSGEVVHVDGFGNLITTLGRLRYDADGCALAPWLPKSEPGVFHGEGAALLPDGFELPLMTTFGDVAPGEPVAYLGSEGLLEIAVRGGSAAERFALTVGAPIQLRFRG